MVNEYERSEIDATIEDLGFIGKKPQLIVKEPVNIDRFEVTYSNYYPAIFNATIGSQVVRLPHDSGLRTGQAQFSVEFVRRNGSWSASNWLPWSDAKRPGLQGPIDDAFTSEFICIRGTGKPWNANVQNWADANLWRFAYEWNRYFRGDLPVRDDKAVTVSDSHPKNVILFGDPGSNDLIRQILPKLPIRWTPKYIEVNGKHYSATDHVPLLIFPSPFWPESYIVINSGHTFHESELNRLNYLLFPRLGDWAVVKVGDKQPSNPSEPLNEEVLQAGFFDENWKFPNTKGKTAP
jgi:hypothetical protein